MVLYFWRSLNSTSKHQKHLICVKTSEKLFEDTIEKCLILSSKLHDIINLINQCFGFQIMLMTATCLAHGIVEYFTLFESLFEFHSIIKNQEKMLKIVLITFYFSVYYNYNVIMVCIMSSFITKEVISRDQLISIRVTKIYFYYRLKRLHN